MMDAKKTMESKTFKYQVLVCFWVTVHLQRFQSAQFIYEMDPLVEKVIANLRKQGRDIIMDIRQERQAKLDAKKGKKGPKA